jgi:hypothetical protein
LITNGLLTMIKYFSLIAFHIHILICKMTSQG